MDYVSHVLPALGEDAVEQRAVTELLDGIEVGREDEPDVARLKADTRLAEVVRRAFELAVRPAPEELVLYVAQATGPVVYRRWQELEPYLGDDAEVTIEELRHAYRVPAEIMELALPLLDLIAPDVDPPLAYRQGGEAPRIVRVREDELLDVAVREAAQSDGLVAVIAPRALAARAPESDAFDEASVPVLTPRRAKGLEFDHVVVVEPAAIAEQGEQGLRELYVALTRPTKTLVVVHARRLPDSLGT